MTDLSGRPANPLPQRARYEDQPQPPNDPSDLPRKRPVAARHEYRTLTRRGRHGAFAESALRQRLEEYLSKMGYDVEAEAA